MKLNISGKIILMSAAGVIASSLIILFISTNLMGGQITRILYNDMGTMRTVVERMQQQEEMRLVQEAQLLITMPQVVDAVYEADIERIREFAQMSWHRLGLDAITFTDTSGIALVRGHTDIKGDDLSSRPSMHAALSGELISGIFFEETAIIPYAIRCYAPIFRDGVLVGALTLGTEIGTETYVDNLYKISGMHFTLFKGDTILITSIRDKEGGRISETRVKPEVSDAVLIKGEIAIVNCEILGEPGMTAYWPIKDIGGNTIGMWALTMSLTQRNNETNRVLMIVILCSLGIIFIIILAASILGSRISKPIRKVTDYAVQVADGNLDVTLDVQSKDEVGLLVGALRAMVITLKERILKEEALNASALQELTEKKELLLSNESLIQEAQRQRIEAEAANKAKSTFLSTMSHEIRTPMNAILGITEIQLQYEALDPNIRDALEKIYTSGDMLLGIINDILDLSKIE
jgi:methyl-accepting chemotaxis protein